MTSPNSPLWQLVDLLVLVVYGELRQWAARHGRAALLQRVDLVAERTASLVEQAARNRESIAQIEATVTPGGGVAAAPAVSSPPNPPPIGAAQ